MTLMVSDNVDYMCMKICFDQHHKDDFWSEHRADAPREQQIRKGSLFTLTQYTTDMENIPPNPWKVPVIRVIEIPLSERPHQRPQLDRQQQSQRRVSCTIS